ncbi:MAG: integrase arm-type DNA-binding domain-containing protein [Rhodobiaceae bacterium]|nr:integrase arm-type DNA-binding domain-containing protein [Rhodobiaceae bacterium]
MGRHPEKALTAVAVKALTKPGRYADGNGLYLVVDPSGAKRWLLRTVVRGRRRDIGLGSCRLVSLAEARDKALAMRKVAREGGDPLAERRKNSETPPTFAEAAKLVHDQHKGAWKNSKHASQWITTLETYAVPEIGNVPVDQISSSDVMRVLGPIWLEKPETARRVRQRIGTVLDWAGAAGYRTGENPVRAVGKGLPRQKPGKDHHAALPYNEVPKFIERLRQSDLGPQTKLAFEFLILSAARTGEVLGARWSEVDWEKRIWTVPAGRMKAGREHRVPLGDRCLDILKEAKELAANSDLIFPGRSPKRPLSNMVFLMALRRMEINATAHGFRSSFRDWAGESTPFPHEVCEMALAHTIKNKAEAAYRRGDLLEKRQELMAAWEVFCEKE